MKLSLSTNCPQVYSSSAPLHTLHLFRLLCLQLNASEEFSLLHIFVMFHFHSLRLETERKSLHIRCAAVMSLLVEEESKTH